MEYKAFVRACSYFRADGAFVLVLMLQGRIESSCNFEAFVLKWK